MKHILKIFLAAVTVVGLFTACNKIDNLKKVDALPVYQLGVSPVLSASGTTVAPTLADSNKAVVTFSWTNPRYAQDSAVYKYILEIDSTGKNFANENTKTVVGLLTTSLTGRDLNAILLNLGFKLNTAQSIDVRLISSYSNNNERYMSNVLKLTVTPFMDPSTLVTANTSVTLTLANAALASNTFSWTNAFTGYPGIVTYTLQYDSAGKNFVAPIEIAVGPSILTKGLTQGEMNATALNSGIPGGNTGKVEYRLKAVTALGAIVFSNVVNVTIQSYVPIVRMYLPGSYQASTGNGNDWDPPTAPELIRDLRAGVFNDMYYIYIYLPAGAQFKVSEGRSWNIAYGTGAAPGSITSNNGGNFSVTNAGFYRITVNRTTLKYDIREGRMGFVGGATAVGWNPPGVFPTYAMGTAATNLFVGINTFPSNGGWKLIDNNAWDNGSKAVDETRSYGTPNGDGSTLEVNGANFADITTSPVRNRVIWDGRDVNNVKYFMSPAAEMRVVGDGINQAGVNDWDPPTSPQMTYTGNGVWTISITLKANKDIKFVAGNAWGAFDYEDNSGQSQAVGTNKKIKWEGGDNFKTPATAGTYTITLNENTQTMRIN
ncbi:SusE domain-containing protein [Ferruginibacter sp. SUN106]|uniref:SusE domain-containing protein n=1 Tax=Ferruginibacter sp. SUN106 TaxID=2978348 RepID=UPI003D3689FA